MPYLYQAGRHPLLADLHWQYVPQRRLRALRVLARSEDASLFAVHPAADKTGVLLGSVQADGLALKGRAPLSLALAVLPGLRQLGDNGIAIFELEDDVFWFIALSQGELSVLSDVTGSRQRIQQVLEETRLFQVSDDGFCIAPAGFFPDRDDVTTPDLATLLSTDRAIQRLQRVLHARLRPVSTQKQNTRLALLLLAGVGLWVGWQHWQSVREQRQEAEARAAIQRDRLARNARKHPTINPWQTRPAPAAFIADCSQQWGRLPLSIAGWGFTVAECGADGHGRTILMARYKRPKNGNVDGFRERLATYYRLKPVFDIPGPASTAQFVQSLKLSPPRKDDVLISASDLMLRLTGYAQALHAPLTIQRKNVVRAEAEKKVPLAWQQFAFTLKTDIPPVHLFPSSLPDGIRINKIAISMSQARLHYTLQGEFYAHP